MGCCSNKPKETNPLVPSIAQSSEEAFHLKVTDDGWTALYEALENLRNTSRISIDFSNLDITEFKLESFGDYLAPIRNITQLYLNFSKCNLEALHSGQDDMIKDLIIDLPEHHSNPDPGWKNFCECLTNKKDLRQLDLDFEEFEEVSKARFTILSQSLSKLRSLMKLTLNFKKWRGKIDDSGLTSLSESLPQLHDLTQLELNFAGCAEITDVGLIAMSQIFGTLRKLSHLILCFSNCDKITSNGLERLCESISQLSNLSLLSLNCSNCQEVTKKESIYEELKKKLPNCTVSQYN